MDMFLMRDKPPFYPSKYAHLKIMHLVKEKLGALWSLNVFGLLRWSALRLLIGI